MRMKKNPKGSDLIDALGGTSAVADIFGIAGTAVSQWRRKGIPAPRLAVMRERYRTIYESYQAERQAQIAASKAEAESVTVSDIADIDLIEALGGNRGVAQFFDIHPSAVGHWRRLGIPAKRKAVMLRRYAASSRRNGSAAEMKAAARILSELPDNPAKPTKEKDADLIDMLGGTVAVAHLCGVSPSAVSHWKREGIPADWHDFLRAEHMETYAQWASTQPPRKIRANVALIRRLEADLAEAKRALLAA